MLKFVVGFILGIAVAASGFTFTDLAAHLDDGVKYIKEAAQEPEQVDTKK